MEGPTADRELVEAVNKAMQPAVDDAAQDALGAVINHEELPQHPDVPIGAVFAAADALIKAWSHRPNGLATWIGDRRPDKLRNARLVVERMTAVAMAGVDRALEQAGEPGADE